MMQCKISSMAANDQGTMLSWVIKVRIANNMRIDGKLKTREL